MVETEKTGINEGFLITLTTVGHQSPIVIGKIDIINPFQEFLSSLKIICDDAKSSIHDLIIFLNNSEELIQLNGNYKYCEALASATGLLSYNNQNQIGEIAARNDVLSLNKKYAIDSLTKRTSSGKIFERGFKEKMNTIDDEYQRETEEFKLEIYKNYELISNAYSINKTYRKCYEDKKIITFSHRIRGWSSPAHNLNEHFSIELKTNFGFGGSSYFYVKIKYKNIDICPISEWINYEFAESSEIIRYTKSYTKKEFRDGNRNHKIRIDNEFWHDALIFAKEACNCSINDEVIFVETYILKECEDMVKGLENIMNKTSFTFDGKDKNNAKKYSVDKSGHRLIDFRGEKIVGALDFISKILEFENITSIENFIKRIEELNRLMQPILVAELLVIPNKLSDLSTKHEELKPEFNDVKEKHKFYLDEKQHIKNEIVLLRKIRANQVDSEEINEVFKQRFPEYDKFKVLYEEIVKHYERLTEEISSLNLTFINITSYSLKIEQYFISNQSNT